MTLGLVEIALPAAFAAPHTLLTPFVAQGGHDSSAATPLLHNVLSPMAILLLCAAAGVGTYLLLPDRRRGAAARSVGGAVLILAALAMGLLLIAAAAKYAGGMGVYFWLFSVVALGGALRVVTHPRPVYAALYFVLTVFATAGLFILLWAEFMAAALVLIYAGAILVTYVFVIMLAASSAQAGVEKLSEYDAVSRDPLIASAVGFALMGVVLFVIFDRAEPLRVGNRTYSYVATKDVGGGRTVDVHGEVNAPTPAAALAAIPEGLTRSPDRLPEPAFNMQSLGRYLFREQAVNLELAGLILTLGMIGAILIARRRVVHVTEWSGGGAGAAQESFTAPATPISDDPYSIPVYGTNNPAQKAYPET
jgi:NADH-quinone oxidoreductase subunit J